MAAIAAAFLQSWLYFGPLDVFGSCIQISKFLHKDSTGITLNSECLTRWKPLVSLILRDRRTVETSDKLMRDAIMEAQSVYSQVIRFTRLESILPSILLMMEVLQSFIGRALGTGFRQLQFPPQARPERRQRLIEKRWYPFTLRRLGSGPESMLSWIDAAQLTRPDRHGRCNS